MLKAGSPPGRLVVKESRVLEAVQAEADLPYPETRLAKAAPRARRRLATVLLLGALVGVLEFAFAGTWLALAAGAWCGASAWGVWKARLGGTLAAGFVATLAALVPLAAWGVLGLSRPDLMLAIVVSALGFGALPDVVTLIRDAELQHAYGLWAKRDA